MAKAGNPAADSCGPQAEAGVQVARTAAGGPREVWLAGNFRPLLLPAVAAAVAAAVALVTALRGGSGMVAAAAAFAAAVLAGVALVLGWQASRPRLARAGASLEIRLSPLSVERVPLHLVECVFMGSAPLPPHGDEASTPTRRVGTLVVRFAERAEEWRSRPAFSPWGTWEDGHAVIDGRWCEPLSTDVARRVAARLLEARREVAT